MTRQTPPGRVRDVARAAGDVFIEKGYRRTLMTDVGARLELSHALLYRYVESKEALFQLALVYAIDEQAISTIDVPVATPSPGQTLALLKTWARENTAFPVLSAALSRSHPRDGVEELLGIIDERYFFIERNSRVLALIERSALDVPELYTFYFTKGRQNQIKQLTQYLQRRIDSEDFRDVSDINVAARFITESISWFAWHRKSDPDSAMLDDEQAHKTVRELLVAAFHRVD